MPGNRKDKVLPSPQPSTEALCSVSQEMWYVGLNIPSVLLRFSPTLPILFGESGFFQHGAMEKKDGRGCLQIRRGLQHRGRT